jgi:aminomethyltransferase
MTGLVDVHDRHDATYESRGGRQVVSDYGRPERTHRAVRNVTGVIEMAYDVLVITGDDRIDYVDNAISNRVPAEDQTGVYALLLDPQGRIRTDMYVYNAGERLLVFVPPGNGAELAEEWRGKTFIQDVDIEDATDEFAIFGVHGAQATEKIASVFVEQTPEQQLSFVRGGMGDAGVTVIRTDGLTGEEGYEVVCSVSEAEDVFDTLANRGLNAAPFGYRTWETLTLEAGTPLFETELHDEVPNNLGLRNAVDFEKGCFVGQEVVSRVENRGRATKRLVGLTTDAVPEAGATVFDGDETAGAVTRGVASPTLEKPIALAMLDQAVATTLDDAELTVRIDGEEHAAQGVDLPFVEGSDESARLPSY